jgi:hypothetical protein
MACALNVRPAAVSLDTVGAVEPEVHDYATTQVVRATAGAPLPVRDAAVRLMVGEREPVTCVKARLHVGGQSVRAHVVGPSAREAVDRAAVRIRQQLASLREQPVLSAGHRAHEPRVWVFGAGPSNRPGYANDSGTDGPVSRRKTYDAASCTPEVAVVRAALLEYDFYLFIGEHTRRPTVVRRRDGNSWQVANPTRCSVTDAIELLGVSNARYVFFLDPTTNALHALYRRYAGDYGLLSPER